jgi:hypothetical protein
MGRDGERRAGGEAGDGGYITRRMEEIAPNLSAVVGPLLAGLGLGGLAFGLAAGLWSLAAALHATVVSPLQFAIWRALLGAGESVNLPGSAKWMRTQYDEERAHALKFFDYVNDRAGRVSLKAIDQPQADFASPLAAWETVLEHDAGPHELSGRDEGLQLPHGHRRLHPLGTERDVLRGGETQRSAEEQSDGQMEEPLSD